MIPVNLYFSCAFYHSIWHTRLRVHRAPGIPRALFLKRRERFIHNPGEIAPRDRGRLSQFSSLRANG